MVILPENLTPSHAYSGMGRDPFSFLPQIQRSLCVEGQGHSHSPGWMRGPGDGRRPRLSAQRRPRTHSMHTHNSSQQAEHAGRDTNPTEVRSIFLATWRSDWIMPRNKYIQVKVNEYLSHCGDPGPVFTISTLFPKAGKPNSSLIKDASRIRSYRKKTLEQ